MACNACWYLLSRGDTRAAHDLASDLRQHWRERLGDDDYDTQTVTAYLAQAVWDMGRHAEARNLYEDVLARRRRVLGADHHRTLSSAGNLAIVLRGLGEVQAARDLDQDNLDRHRRALGADHPDTLPPPTTSPSTCACWGRCRPPGTWSRTPWTAAAGC